MGTNTKMKFGKKIMGVNKLYNLYKAYQTGKTITKVKPLKKIPGSKTVEQHKKQIFNIKSEATNKQYLDEIRRAGAKLTGKVNQTAKNLQKLNETLKKQKKHSGPISNRC